MILQDTTVLEKEKKGIMGSSLCLCPQSTKTLQKEQSALFDLLGVFFHT
tara:strand:- start:391 stop:537 length:147 start_codon:yes stop_codon:yes gene_type:complete